jgi:hypothetical protein
MSEYFSYFPKIQHDLTEDGTFVELTNVLRRFIIRPDVQERSDVFYEYDIQAGDRPDIIAEKYYGDPDLAWLVLLFNNITDPVFDWALFNTDFDRYIRGKYGSLANAQAQVHEYRQVIHEAKVTFDGRSIPKYTVVIDEATYNTLDETKKELITKFDWELEQNEQKRKIKILDKRYLNRVRDEVEYILKDDE